MSRSIDFSAWIRRQFMPDRVWGVVGWCVIALVLMLVLVVAWPIVAATRAPSSVRLAPMNDKDFQARVGKFDSNIAMAVDRIKARAPFGIVKAPEREKPKTSVPTSYGGPSIAGVVGDQVIFADGKRVAIGQSDPTVEVVSMELPWSVKLRWRGGEFNVDLFARNTVNLEQPMSGFVGALGPLPVTTTASSAPATPSSAAANPPPGAGGPGGRRNGPGGFNGGGGGPRGGNGNGGGGGGGNALGGGAGSAAPPAPTAPAAPGAATPTTVAPSATPGRPVIIELSPGLRALPLVTPAVITPSPDGAPAQTTPAAPANQTEEPRP